MEARVKRDGDLRVGRASGFGDVVLVAGLPMVAIVVVTPVLDVFFEGQLVGIKIAFLQVGQQGFVAEVE